MILVRTPPRSGASRRGGVPARVTVAFLAAYVVAVVLGRHTRLEDGQLALLWPAAGIGCWWLLVVRRERGHPAAPVALLAGAAAVLNLQDGTAPGLALLLAAANAVHAVTGCAVIARLQARDWRFDRTRELSVLLAGAVAASVSSGAVASLTLHALRGIDLAPALGVWILRNSASTFVVLLLGVTIASWRRDPSAASLVPRASTRAAELTCLTLVSATAHVLVFGAQAGTPLAFLVVPLGVWAGLRFSTQIAGAHAGVSGAVMIGLTLTGRGPFGTQPPVVRTMLVQSFLVITSFLTLAVARDRDQRARLVRQLAAARRVARERAALLDGVIENVGDGIAAVDGAGRFLLFNGAARRLLGTGPADVDRAAWSEHFGFRRADGTLHPTGDLPISRASRGERATVADVLVRNPAVPGGRTVAMSASPLAGVAGGGGAVAVLRDVTLERGREAELAAFAGVVAHDLLNPITALDAWVQTLQEILARDRADPIEIGSVAGRLESSAARMRVLVEQLLAYSTARDSALAPEEVDLRALVRDASSALVATTRPTPQVTVGALPGVVADPVLLRRLVDNVLGNAVKYTAPDEPARVAVSAVDAGPGWVDVRVVDRGIGVPAGERERVFDDFYRAHPGDRYAGTGLGLAICRRIVARHGGRIELGDGPAGGTCVRFTLPVAGASAPPVDAVPAPAREASAADRMEHPDEAWSLP